MAEQSQHPDPHVQDVDSDDLDMTASIQPGPEPESVATILREAREQHNRSLRDVAAALNIRYVYLQAIEDRQFDKLPGTTYAIGFLRSYAEHLGLDGADVINRFKAEVAGLDKRTQLVFPTPVPEGKVPGGALILVSVLFLALAYGAWSFFSGQEERVAELVPAVPERLQDLLGEDPGGPRAAAGDPARGALPPGGLAAGSADLVEDAAESGTATSMEDAQHEAAPGQVANTVPSSLETAPFETAPIESNAPSAEEQAARQGETASSSSPAVVSEMTNGSAAPLQQPAAVSPAETTTAVVDRTAATPDPEIQAAPATQPEAIPDAPATDESAVAYRPLEAQVYGRGNLDSRIILRATQDAWVQVRDSKEDLLFTRVLRSGDSYRVPNQAGLTLLTGNAGGLDVEVDGTYLGALGSVGSVRRNVILEPGKLRKGTLPGE